MRILIFILLFPFIASAQFSGLANNQAVSNTNLNNAVTNGYFTGLTTIPTTGLEVTKARAITYISGFNANYPPFAAKASNQLIVKSDFYNPGNYILDAAYGMSFTSMSGSVGGLPTFTYPVSGGNTTKTYNGIISAQTLTIGLSGTLVSSPAKIVLYVDGIIVDCQNITTGVQTKTLTIPNSIFSPSNIKISINLSSCAAIPVVSFSASVSAVAISRTTGQYQIAGVGNADYYNSYAIASGYISTSSDYGATWTKRTPYGYWATVSVSDDGQYMLAGDLAGNAYISSNYGATWTQTLSYSLQFFQASAISNGGTYMYLSTSVPGGYTPIFLVSTNQGSTWNNVSWGAVSSIYRIYALTISSTGQYLYAGYSVGGQVANSSNYGSTASFNTVISPISTQYFYIESLSSSASGANAILSYVTYNYNNSSVFAANYLKATTNSGSSWSDITGGSTGQQIWKMAAINNSGTGYAVIHSINGSTSYLQQITTLSSISPITTPGIRTWQCIAISGNGTYILAGHYNGLYRSADGGSTWSAL